MGNKRFTIIRDHIKLVKSIIIGWNPMTNRATIDDKRPYGDSDIPRSVAEAINLDFVEIEGGEMVLTSQQEKYCWKLNKDMATVLQIVLSTGSFRTGDYESDEYGLEWKRVGK